MTGGPCLVSGASMTGGSSLISGAHSVGELTEPTKLRGATTKVAAEAVRPGGTRRHRRHEFARGVEQRRDDLRTGGKHKPSRAIQHTVHGGNINLEHCAWTNDDPGGWKVGMRSRTNVSLHVPSPQHHLRPRALQTTPAPARDSRGTAAFAPRRGHTRTDGRTARQGASSGEPCTRCTWTRRQWRTRERRCGR